MPALHLSHGNLRLSLRPDLGGCIAGLWLGDVPVLRSGDAAALNNVRQSASYPLVPFSNRIGGAQLQWNGTSHPLVKNFAPEAHAIHGVGWQRAWEVLDASDSFAMLSLEHKPDSSWPFAFDCSQTFQLSARGLEMTLSITNQSPQPAPAGLGWHPFFVKRPDTRIALEAAGRWDMGADKLPTERRASKGLQADCAVLDIDHCFDGWSGAVQLHDTQLATRVTSGLSHLVVFTTAGKDFIAVEPVSHVNNAINIVAANRHGTLAPNPFGIKTLAPGESWTVAMAISSEAST